MQRSERTSVMLSTSRRSGTRYFNSAVGICALVAALAWMLVPAKTLQAAQATFYAAPNGSGSLCSQSAPCSLAGARDKVRTVNAAMSGDIIVYVRGGTYALTTPFALTAQDSGSNGYSVIYQAFTGETPTISGGQAITGWTLHDASKNIYRASVGTTLDTRQLVVNGTLATRARTAINPSGFAVTSSGYTTTDSAMQNWGNPTAVEFIDSNQWRFGRCQVNAISGTTITLKQPCFENAQNFGGRPIFDNAVRWVENAYELLDSEGEWYLNRTSGTLYYKPRAGENMVTASVVAPVGQTLVSMMGTLDAPVHHIQFKGLTFANSTWLDPNSNNGYAGKQTNYHLEGTRPNLRDEVPMPGALALDTVKNIRFERNTFTRLGAVGLDIKGGSQDNTIIGNRFTDIAGSGIQIGGVTLDDHHPSDARRIVKNTTIRNNLITRIGTEFHDGVAIFVSFTEATVIEHNDMFDLPYSGVSIGWGWGEVEPGGSDGYTIATTAKNAMIRANLIYDFVKSCEDAGGVYTIGNQPNSFIRENYIHDKVKPQYSGVYLDVASKFFTIDSNVLRNVTYSYLIHQGSGNTFQNNFWNETGMLSGVSQNDNSFTNNTVVTNNNWPAAAQTIMNNAGLEPAYADLRTPGSPTPTPTTVPNNPTATPTPPTSTTNVALNKPATASSSYNSSYTPERAVDNNTGTLWAAGGTNYPQWWQVDLGSAYRITRLEFVTRQDFDQDNSRGAFEVRASNDSTFATYTVLGSQGSPVAFQATWAQDVSDTNTYRYVRVAKTNNDTLVIAELRAFAGGNPPTSTATPTATPTPPASATNIALNKPATASSSYSASHTPERAIDNNTGTMWAAGGTNYPQWWQVDLGAPYRVTRLEFATRQDFDQDNSRGAFEVRASNDSSFTNYTVLGSQASPVAFKATWAQDVSDTNTYRYLRVAKTNNDTLVVAEFRVFGQ